MMKPLGNNPFSSFLSGIYALIVWCRNTWYDVRGGRRLGRFTVSVGGISAGGTGKTPLAILVGRHFTDEGHEVAFLSRGYRRIANEQVIVGPGEQVRWQDIGDEPYMIHESLPNAWLGIGADRCRAGAAISPRLGRQAVFVLDDGFQHRRAYRDIDIVCCVPNLFDDSLIPSGYMREPLSRLRRAHIICLVGIESDADQLAQSRKRLSERFHAPVLVIYQKPGGWINARTGRHCDTLALKRPALVCAIARPERFLDMTRSLGVQPACSKVFEDHHVFKPSDLDDIAQNGDIDGIVTTQKDACRICGIKLVPNHDIWYLRIEMAFGQEDMQRTFLSVLASKLTAPSTV